MTLTLWHYLWAFSLGSLVSWTGGLRCALRRRWLWATVTFLSPLLAAYLWLTQLWLRMDWEAGSFDQPAWILIAESALLLAVWCVGIAAWVHCRRSTHRRAKNHAILSMVLFAVSTALLLGACGTEQPGGTVPSASSAATPASTSSTATTRLRPPATTAHPQDSTTPSPGPPAFLRFGSFGVIEVDDGRETALVNEPVIDAFSDGGSGALFSYERRSGIWHVTPGSEPVGIVPGYDGGYAVVDLDGRPAIVRLDTWEDRRCEEGSFGAYDLRTGTRTDFVVCAPEGDVGWFPRSYGGGRFVGVRWDAVGSCQTGIGIQFWDRRGGEVDVPANPYPFRGWDDPLRDWVPCELEAYLSPDGRLLAYRYRPDNKWPCPEYGEVPYQEWFETSRKIPGEVVVLDLDTGSELFRATVPAAERLIDFDGRFLVWSTSNVVDPSSPTSRIADVLGEIPDQAIEGRVRLLWAADPAAIAEP